MASVNDFRFDVISGVRPGEVRPRVGEDKAKPSHYPQVTQARHVHPSAQKMV